MTRRRYCCILLRDRAANGYRPGSARRVPEIRSTRGNTIRVHHKTREEDDPNDFDAEAVGVSADGMLRVRPKAGGPERMLSGEEVSISPMLAGFDEDAQCEMK